MKHGLEKTKSPVKYEYRVLQTYKKDRHGRILPELTIRKVFYDENDILFDLSPPLSPFGDTKTQIKKDIQEMRMALKQEFLTPKDFPNYIWTEDEYLDDKEVEAPEWKHFI